MREIFSILKFLKIATKYRILRNKFKQLEQENIKLKEKIQSIVCEVG